MMWVCPGLRPTRRWTQAGPWDHRRVRRGVTGRCREGVAISVYYANVRGVQPRRPATPQLLADPCIPRNSTQAVRVSSRWHLGPGLVFPDEGTASLGVRLGQQTRHRYFHEPRVTVVPVAVGEGQLQGLGYGVNIARRVVPLGPQVVAPQEIQGLQQDRALAPGTTGIHVDITEGYVRGRLYPSAELRQILRCEEPAVVAVKLHNGGRDVPLIEGVPSCSQSGFPPLAPGVGLFIHHILQRPCEVRLPEDVARLRRPAAGQVDSSIGRPPAILIGVGPNLVS